MRQNKFLNFILRLIALFFIFINIFIFFGIFAYGAIDLKEILLFLQPESAVDPFSFFKVLSFNKIFGLLDLMYSFFLIALGSFALTILLIRVAKVVELRWATRFLGYVVEQDWPDEFWSKVNKRKYVIILSLIVTVGLYAMHTQWLSIIVYAGYNVGEFFIHLTRIIYFRLFKFDLFDTQFYLVGWLFQWYFIYFIFDWLGSVIRKAQRAYKDFRELKNST